MKSNIFLVHTEYHLYLSINIIFSKYQDYDNYIYIAGDRIRKEINIDSKYCVFYRLSSEDYGTKETLTSFLSHRSERLFFFQEGSSDNIFLAYELHRKGCTIALVQDGLKPYPVWHRKHLLAHILLDTGRYYIEMLRRHALAHTLFKTSYKYGTYKFVDELWLQYPKAYNNHSNKLLQIIPDCSEDSYKALCNLYGFNIENFQNDSIFFLAETLIRYDDCMQKEIEIINNLIQRFPNKVFYYKEHPGTPEHCIKKIKELFPDLIVVNDGIPAELHILGLHGSIIVSMFSTSCLTNNPNCRFYWTHKLYPRGRFVSQVTVVNPTEHIKEVTSCDEIL